MRAAFLVQVEPARYQPVLFLPRQTPDGLLVPMAPLRPRPTRRAPAVPLGPRTIDTDRHRLVFPQPGAVVILEVRSARTFRIPVRDENLVTAGWAPDGHTVVATSSTGRWLVDTRRGTVVRAGGEVVPGWADIGVSGGRPMIRTFSGAGRLLSLRSLDGPEIDAYGEPISNIEGWACRATFFGASNATLGRMQGLMAAQSDVRPQPRILAAPNDAPLFAYRPLGWGPRDTVLLESRSVGRDGPVRRLLAWDVIEGRMYRVAELDAVARYSADAQPFTGGALGALTVAQGGRAGGARARRVGDPAAPRPDVGHGVDAHLVQREGHLRGRHARPHDVPTGVSRCTPAAAATSRMRVGGRNVPSAASISVIGRLTAPGRGRPRGRSARPRRGSARGRARRGARRGGAIAAAPSASRTGTDPARTTRSPGSGDGTSVVTGCPARSQAARPPSRTRTCGCPAQRRTHHARAADSDVRWS